MTANPIDLVLVDGVAASKSDARGFEKLRVRQRVADANEIRNTSYSGQFGGLYKADTQTLWDIDTDDTTTADDGVNCIVDADGNRWKPVSSVPAPTTESLGGVFSHAAESHKFLTGIDTDGTPLSAQPSAADLSDGVEGTGAVVLKSYADGLIDAFNALHYEGDMDCSANPDYPAADTGDLYIVSVAGKIGGASGVDVDLGDWLVCKSDGSASGDQATVGANWSIIQTNVVGAVTLSGTQTLTNKTINGADNSLTVRLGSDVTGNLPNANLAAMADKRFKGNVSGSSATPSDLTITQVLDAVGSTRGSVLYRGASGWAIVTPGTSGQVLTSNGSGADPSYQDATGSGGGISDTDRRNLLLSTAYQSKSFASYRRLINLFATGFKGANDTANGIDTGSSSNYVVNATSGYVAPSKSFTSQVSQTLTTNNTSFGGYTLRELIPPGSGGVNGTSLRITLTPPTSGNNTNVGAVYVGHVGGSAPDFDGTQVQVTFSGSNTTTLTAGGATVVSDEIPYAYDRTKALIVSIYMTGTSDVRYVTGLGSTYNNYNKNANDPSGTTATGYSSASGTMMVLSKVESSNGANNMTLVTASQTTDASVSNGRVLLEFDNAAAPTLNADLTVEVTCDGGSNWAAATLSSVTAYSQGGRSVAETADTTCTAGTSFAARIKTLNNKNVPVYAASLQVH